MSLFSSSASQPPPPTPECGEAAVSGRENTDDQTNEFNIRIIKVARKDRDANRLVNQT